MKRRKSNGGEAIGSYLKHERLALGLNQDFVCKDICSVSYYSRIENNQIQPSKEQLSSLLLKMNRDLPHNLNKSDVNPLIHQMHLYIDAHNEQGIKEIVEHAKGMNHYQTLIIDLMYFVHIQDIVNSKAAIKKMIHYQKWWTCQEVETILLKQGEYYFQIQQHQKAYDYFTLLLKMIENPPIFLGRFYYFYAQVLSKLNYQMKTIYFAQEAERIYSQKSNFYFLIKLKWLIGYEFSFCFPEKGLSILEELVEVNQIDLQHNHYQICLSHIAVVYKQFNQLLKSYHWFKKCHIDQSKELCIDGMIEYIDLLTQLNRYDELTAYYESLKQDTFNNRLIQLSLKQCHIKLNHQQDEEEQLKFYLHDLIPYTISIHDLKLEMKYRQKYILLLDKLGKQTHCLSQYKQLFSIFNRL